MGPPALVTLTTDIGDGYAAQVKGVLYRRLPAGSVVDLSLNLSPHNILEAAFLLRWMAGGFPAGSVHLAVVDPGVGGERAPIAIQCGDGSSLVGPDNGLLDPLARALGKPRAVELDPALVAEGRPVSATFEGRDLFAPAALRLAEGTPLEELGRPFTHRALEIPRAKSHARGARGVVLHVDRFGNVITNLPPAEAGESGTYSRVSVGRRPTVRAVSARTYEDLPAKVLGLIVSSYGLVELCRPEASAAALLKAQVGEVVDLSRDRAPKARRAATARRGPR